MSKNNFNDALSMNFFEYQVIENLKNEDFEKQSIKEIIIEILTILNCRDSIGKKYIDDIKTEDIHQYIKDLEILYKISKQL